MKPIICVCRKHYELLELTWNTQTFDTLVPKLQIDLQDMALHHAHMSTQLTCPPEARKPALVHVTYMVRVEIAL